jgi:hypothetical protein
LWTLALKRRLLPSGFRVHKFDQLADCAAGMASSSRAILMLVLEPESLLEGAELVARRRAEVDAACTIVAWSHHGHSVAEQHKFALGLLELGATYVTHSVRDIEVVVDLMRRHAARAAKSPLGWREVIRQSLPWDEFSAGGVMRMNTLTDH